MFGYGSSYVLKMEDSRKILEFSVNESDFESWLRDNRSLMIFEIVSTAEDMLYNQKEVGDICKIRVRRNGGNMIVECKLHIDDVIHDVDYLLEFAVEMEEYELAHRIKLLNEYIDKNGLKKTIRRFG
jgi:hypothetical protein